MRIGSIAQHSNITPTGPDSLPSFINAIPGRIGQLGKIWGWWDFTDIRALGGGSSDATTTTNLQLIDDKGPHDADASADAASKGPKFNTTKLGQDNHHYVWAAPGQVDYMKFQNPTDLDIQNFTAMIVMDFYGTTYDNDQVIFKIAGSSNDFLQVYWETTYRNLTVHYKNSSGAEYAFTHKGYGLPNYTNALTSQTGGDLNTNFNFIYIVGDGGSIKVYIRGHETEMKSITMDPPGGDFPTGTLASGNVSYLLSNTQTNNDDEQQIHAEMYEILMYSEALDSNQLKHLDWYMHKKYPTYPYSRLKQLGY